MSNQQGGRSVVRSAVSAVVVSTVVMMLLTGCSVPNGEVTQSQAVADGASTLQKLEVPLSSVPAKYYQQRVAWQECKGDECGVVRVPEDWSDPNKASIGIALIEHRAPGVALGTIVVDPGGPGGSGVQWVEQDFADVVDSAVAARYNVVGFDPRGVGYSTAVSCLSATQLEHYIFAPTVGAIGSSAWIADQRHRATVLADGCAGKSGELLDNVDTVSVAHDLDVIRSALGERKLNYFGASWGTYLGTVYAGLYPTKTGRIVLDGAFDPWSSINQDGTAQAVGFEDDLDAYLTACLAGATEAVGDGKCPFSGTRSAAEHSISSLFSSADRHPIAGPAGLRLDGSVLDRGVLEALYSPRYWPLLTTMFTQLRTGVTTEAMVLIGARYSLDEHGVPYDNFEVAFTAVRCLEDGSSTNLERDRLQLQALEKRAPVFGRYEAYGDLTCSHWHYGPAPFPVPIHASDASQMLVVGTTGDPATPYQEAKDLAEQLTTSHLVTYHGQGHTAYDKGDACVNRVVDDYFLNGAVPANDPECH